MLQSKVNYLEESKSALEKNYEEEVTNFGIVQAELKDETSKLNNLHRNFDTLEGRFKNIASENRKLAEKNQTSLAEVKILKSENEELISDVNNLNLVIKTLKKEAKEKVTKFEKETKKLVETVQQLEAHKITKTSEEKAFRKKQKKLGKKLKKIVSIKPPEFKAPKEFLGLDYNENESTILTSNSFAPLANLEFESSDDKEADSLAMHTAHSLLLNPISHPTDMFNIDMQQVSTSLPFTSSPSAAGRPRSPHTPPGTPPSTGSSASSMATPLSCYFPQSPPGTTWLQDSRIASGTNADPGLNENDIKNLSQIYLGPRRRSNTED